MNVVLTPDGPLDAAATLSRYRIWGEDPVNRLGDGVFRRVVRRGNQLVPYEVRWQGSVDDPKLLLRIGTLGYRIHRSRPGQRERRDNRN